MDATEALRIARLALAMNYRIEPDIVDGKYRHDRYVAAGFTKQDAEAADAYNRLAELQRDMDIRREAVTINSRYVRALFDGRFGNGYKPHGTDTGRMPAPPKPKGG